MTPSCAPVASNPPGYFFNRSDAMFNLDVSKVDIAWVSKNATINSNRLNFSMDDPGEPARHGLPQKPTKKCNRYYLTVKSAELVRLVKMHLAGKNGKPKVDSEFLWDIVEFYGLPFHLGAALESIVRYTVSGNTEDIDSAQLHLSRAKKT